ncbi:hypothetical protein BX667DRAFT_533554 [Coemansia mojavensis]|nr:hypothetical protein BX667DRAFT_533554 [Coemansia mojavensis]
MAKSALYILASTTLITSVPLLILQRLSLISLSDITISGSTFELAVGCVFGLLLWNSKFISVWSTSIFSYVSSKASQYLGITEYVTGKQNILDEGQWSFKGMKWLYIPFAKYFMPNYIVENAFKQAHVRLSDRAKVGKKRKSLPTKKYYARIQQAIDRSLTDTCLAFTLKPNNVRVPGTNSTNVHKMRKYAIPLNDDGMPVDPMYDYEAADHPERRKWAKSQGMVIPPSVVDEYDGKYIFKKSDYSTVYLPPALELLLPALLGMVREMYISVPYYHYYSSGYPQYTSDTSLLQVASRMWKNNVIPAIAGSFALFFTTDNEWLDDVYVSIFDGNSLRQVWRLVKRRAIPAAAKLVAIYLLPILLAAVNLMLNHSLTSDTFRRLVLLKDADVLAPLVRISMLSYAVVLFATKVIVTYRNCVQVVRDKLYAVNQILENVDGSSTPHFGPSEPATPTAA